MFDSIQGRLDCREPARCVVEAGGIGYEIHVPLSTYEALPPKDTSVRLLLHLVVREDEWKLFGFATPGERDVFRALLRVNGVGPMIGLGLLSGLKPREFQDAVAQGDVRALTRVKGIGKKTAERIVVELRDVMAGGPLPPGPSGTGDVADVTWRDAVAALEALGVDSADARRRVEKAAQNAPHAEVPDLVRAALKG